MQSRRTVDGFFLPYPGGMPAIRWFWQARVLTRVLVAEINLADA